jgi:hypothetical protein
MDPFAIAAGLEQLVVSSPEPQRVPNAAFPSGQRDGCASRLFGCEPEYPDTPFRVDHDRDAASRCCPLSGGDLVERFAPDVEPLRAVPPRNAQSAEVLNPCEPDLLIPINR